MRLCSLDGCGKQHIARGYCQNHYRVFMRHGTPVPEKQPIKVHVASGGYLFKSAKGKTRYLHIDVVERALGKPLPAKAEIHHVNGIPSDNRPENLVVCPNHEYHMLLHQRERAIAACGNADARPCKICGVHDLIENMRPHRKQFYHTTCLAKQSFERRELLRNPKQ